MVDRLAEIEAQLKAATPGPYVKCLGSGNNVCTAVLTYAVKNRHGNHPIIADCLPSYCLRHDTAVDGDHRPNLTFIERSWGNVGYLVAEVKRLRARGTCGTCANWHGNYIHATAECLSTHWLRRGAPLTPRDFDCTAWTAKDGDTT